MTEKAEKIRNELQNISSEIDDILAGIAGERVAFSLFVWSGDEGNYVSNSSDIKGAILKIEEFLRMYQNDDTSGYSTTAD